MFHPLGLDSNFSTNHPTEYRCLHIRGYLIWAAGAEASSRTEKSFVCQTTPHFGSTSREVSYSVRNYHTTSARNCKSPICRKPSVFMNFEYKWRNFVAKKPCFLCIIDL